MTTRYISSLNTQLSLKLCVIAGLKCYFCWIYKTSSYRFTSSLLSSLSPTADFCALFLESRAHSSHQGWYCHALLSWVQPMFLPVACCCSNPISNAHFRKRNLLAWAAAKRKGSSELRKWITIPSFMLVTLKGIKIEGFHGRKIPITRLQMLQKVFSLWEKDVWKQIFLLTNTPVTILKKIGSVTCSAHLWMCIASEFRVS